MLNKLKRKWGVTNGQLIRILCIFAITGTSTAYLTKAATRLAGFDAATYWLWKVLLRIGMLTIGYQLILLAIAF